MKNIGFYRCDGIDFVSKIKAFRHGKTVHKPVEWIFHDEMFDRYPWHIEPQESLDQLYDRRARQLREQYDYIIVSYSGGADSHNVVESFLRQGLHIDEIVTNHTGDLTKNFLLHNPKVTYSWNFNAEHRLQALPRLQHIRNHFPQVKITELDISPALLNSFTKIDDVDWVLSHNDQLSLSQMFRYNYDHFGSLKKTFDKSQKVAIIVGIDKPRVSIQDNNDVVVSLVDSICNIAPIDDFNQDYDNVQTEFFYWTPNCPELMCKQAHFVKNWLRRNPFHQKYWRGTNYKTIRLVQEPILRNLLYSNWDASWFQADKATYVWHTEFDTWVKNTPEHYRVIQRWQAGIDFLATELSDQILYDDLGRPDRFKPFLKNYKIGSIIT
jgi:hypothetical protein